MKLARLRQAGTIYRLQLRLEALGDGQLPGGLDLGIIGELRLQRRARAFVYAQQGGELRRSVDEIIEHAIHKRRELRVGGPSLGRALRPRSAREAAAPNRKRKRQ